VMELGKKMVTGKIALQPVWHMRLVENLNASDERVCWASAKLPR
jgi:hypothetical protein